MSLLYALLLLTITVFSYTTVDPHFVLIHSPVWIHFRDMVTAFWIHNSSLSAVIYFTMIVFLFLFHLLFLRAHKKISIMRLVVIVVICLFFSYPFLSRDIFSYMFDARILTVYHRNVLTTRPDMLSHDVLFQFIPRKHYLTPYGPVFIIISLIPAFLSVGNIFIHFVLLKALIIGFYVLAVYYLNRWNKEWAVFFATQPLIIIEGVVNIHNDMIALSLAIIGMYYIFHKSQLKGRLLLLISGLVKYISLPLLLVARNKKNWQTKLMLLGIFIVLLYAAGKIGMEPWYFLVLFAFIPLWFDRIRSYEFFYFGILVGYVYYIEHGDWFLAFLYQMMFGSFVINFIYNTTHGLFIRDRKKG